MIFRNASVADADAIAAVEKGSWPIELAATAPIALDRIQAYTEGQIVAERDCRLLAASTAQRISAEFLNADSYTYARVTDNGRLLKSHCPDGEIYQLVGVGVLPECWGSNLGRRLLDQQLQFARTLPGIERIIGFTRPARYYRYQNTPIEEYVQKRTPWGRLVDPVLSFHLDGGARFVSIHPNFRPPDHRACGYGVMIEYPLETQAES